MASDDCEKVLDFFTDEINSIKSQFKSVQFQPPQVSQTVLLSEFKLTSSTDLLDVVSYVYTSPCPTEIPPKFIKEAHPAISPCFSLLSILPIDLGAFQITLKSQYFSSTGKKKPLDPSVWNNYRPVSKLPFISKILEKAVARQLLQLVDGNNNVNKFQSAYRLNHSTETALLKITNDILISSPNSYHCWDSILDWG